MKRALTVCAALSAAAPWPAVAAPRATVELQCLAFGAGPQLECTVELRGADAQALSGAAVTLGASMPSMPMAHQVKPALAAPTGTPGQYRGRLTLEMSGAWAVQVDVSGPLRERFARTLRVDACEGERRCPALPVATQPVTKPTTKP